jgi:hypothetical protein
MSKPNHVPETHGEPKPNRAQRRHPDRVDAPADEPLERERTLPEQDVPSVRAKNSGHRKKTADKWNQ